MSYQEIKYKRLIHMQIIINIEIYLDVSESYLEIRKQISWKS